MPEFHGKLGIVFKDDIKGGAIEIGEKKGQMEIKVESHGKAVKENGIFPFRRKPRLNRLKVLKLLPLLLQQRRQLKLR